MPALKRFIVNLVTFGGILFFSMPLQGFGRNEFDHKKDYLVVTQMPFSEISQWYAFAKTDSTSASEFAEKEPDAFRPNENTQSKREIYRAYNKINNIALWLLGDESVSEFKRHMIEFGDNNLPHFINQFYSLLIEKTYTYPIVIFFIFFIILLLFNVNLVLLIMYFSNNIKNRKERYINIYRNSYEEILRAYLFGEIEWD